jgi:hypothetical protein
VDCLYRILRTNKSLSVCMDLHRGGDGLAVNMSGQHVCVLRVRVPLLPPCGLFWRLIWRTESLDRGLILVCRFSFVSSRECIPVAAQTRSCLQGWMRVRNPVRLPNGQADVMFIAICAPPHFPGPFTLPIK